MKGFILSFMKIFAALLLSLFVLAGCGGGLEKKVVGTWKIDSAKTQMGDAKMDETEKKMMMAVMSSISLEVKEDKTFTMTVMMPIEGKWTLAGNKLTLTPTLKEGEKMSFGGKSTMEFDVDADGTSMSSKVEDEKMPGTLVMSKEAAK